MPGIIMPVKVTDEKLIAELEDMRNRGQAYVGGVLAANGTPRRRRPRGEGEDVFDALSAMKRTTTSVGLDGEEMVDEDEADPADHMHDIGTFCAGA